MPDAHTLPDNPVYAFTPSYDIGDEVQQIRIVIQDIPGFIPTSLVALTVRDAEDVCDYGDDRTMVRCRVKAP